MWTDAGPDEVEIIDYQSMGRVVNRMRAVHPGEVLREEYLAPLSLSVTATAMAR